MPTLRRVLAVLLLAAASAAVVATSASAAAPGLTATYSSTDNGSWLLDKYVVANPTTAAVTGWTLEFDLPPGRHHGQAPTTATLTQTGSHVTINNAYYNGTVAAGRRHRAVLAVVHRLPARAGADQLPDQRQQVRRQSPTAPRAHRPVCRVTGTDDPDGEPAWNTAVATDFPIAGVRDRPRRRARRPATGTTALVTGLTPNTAYSFTVRGQSTPAATSRRASAAVP